MSMIIETDQLRKMINEALDVLDVSQGSKSFAVENDLYWYLKDEDVYDLDKVPTEHDVGNIKDEWKFLTSALEENRINSSTHLEYIASVLRCISFTKKYIDTDGREIIN